MLGDEAIDFELLLLDLDGEILTEKTQRVVSNWNWSLEIGEGDWIDHRHGISGTLP